MQPEDARLVQQNASFTELVQAATRHEQKKRKSCLWKILGKVGTNMTSLLFQLVNSVFVLCVYHQTVMHTGLFQANTQGVSVAFVGSGDP